MKPVPFMAALLVIVAMTMPWFTPESKNPEVQMFGITSLERSSAEESNQGLSFVDIVRDVYLKKDVLKQDLMIGGNKGVSNIFLSLVAFPLIILGAFIGLFKGKFGHAIGLIGMVIFTLSLVYGSGEEVSLRIGFGYLLAWVGFSVGLVSAVVSK
ncbi:LuxR family transcriptional regulator [Thermococcus gorgonarius]|uniref:Uncharacterized protein n=1 Tax=Thermococcus gorgonarius TaxID=71997 RepID=A0A2Z2M7H8_THEGO|nr:LuxR family transcriptional regulator [Thermococcus gorgonarius]ASJ00272.1 hypothetical protein A3K92_01650 [Thermococcus gorgonarius]